MLSYAKMFKRTGAGLPAARKMKAARYMSRTYNKAVGASLARAKYSSNDQSGHSYGFKKFFYPAAALGVLSLYGGYEMYKNKKTSAECCGIIGYIGEENIAGRLVLDGLQILQYRGYDS